MTQRRWAIHILGDILSQVASLPGIRKGQIRSKTDMNFYQTEAYLNFLIEKGFISRMKSTNGQNGRAFYELTTGGEELLHRIQDLVTYMEVGSVEEPLRPPPRLRVRWKRKGQIKVDRDRVRVGRSVGGYV